MMTTRSVAAHAFHPFLVVLCFSLVHLAFFGVAFVEGSILAPGDAFIQSLPNYWTRPSGWTPLLYSGYPLAADPQAMAWYPPAMLLSRVPHSWNTFVLLAYVMASSFSYGYVYRITGSRFAAAVSGLVFGLNSFFIAHLGHTNMVHSAAWVPLIIWGVEEIWRGGGRVWGAVLSLAVAHCLLAGHPQIFAYAMLLVVCYWIFLERQSRRDARSRLLFLGSIGVGIGLAGILILPMLELAGESIRVDQGYRYFVSGSLRILQLPQLVFPYVWGGWHVPLLGGSPVAYFARGNPTETGVFAGVLPLLLAGVALLTRSKSQRAGFWIFVAVAALLFALGRQLHLVAPLYLVPGFDRFRIPARHLMEFHLALSVLSGLGVAAIAKLDFAASRALLWRSARWIGGFAAFSVLIVVAVLLSGYWQEYRDAAGVARVDAWPWSNPTLALQLIAMALGGASLVFWCRVRRKSAALLVCIAIVVDLGCYGWLAEWRASPAAERQAKLPKEGRLLRDELQRSGQRLLSLGLGSEATWTSPNRNLLSGIPNASGYGPLVLKRYAEFARMGPYGVDDFELLSDQDHALDLLAVRQLLVPEEQASDAQPYLANAVRWRFVTEHSGTKRYENVRALPRAWLVGEVQRASSEVVLASIRGSRLPDGRSFDPREFALVEGEVGAQTRASCGSDCGEVERVLVESDRLQLRVRADESAFLVVSDVHYPGWVARVNGERVPLHRSNYVLRGLWVPAGDSDVELSFESGSFQLGASLTGASAALWLVGALSLLPSLVRGGRAARTGSR